MTSIRVAVTAELPPGKGKILSIHDREVRVYNLDGRFFATASREGRIGHGPPDTTHTTHGAMFDVHVEDSPARVRADQEHLAVRVDGETVWIEMP